MSYNIRDSRHLKNIEIAKYFDEFLVKQIYKQNHYEKNIYIYNNIYLCYNYYDDCYMIVTSANETIKTINKEIRMLISEEHEKHFIPYIDNSEEYYEGVTISNINSYTAIYIEQQIIFIDILEWLLYEYPRNTINLIDGFSSWDKLNDLLFNYKTYFVGDKNISSYSLHNVKKCSVLRLYNYDGLYTEIPGLKTVEFELIKIYYSPEQLTVTQWGHNECIKSFGPLPHIYNAVSIKNNYLFKWENCYEEGFIPDEFINKVVSIKSDHMYYAVITNSGFIERLLLSTKLIMFCCHLRLEHPNCTNIVKLILSNKYLEIVHLHMNSTSNINISEIQNTDIEVSDNITYLQMTKNFLNIGVYTLTFSPETKLKSLLTPFPIKSGINLFKSLEVIKIFGDIIIESLAESLCIKKKNLACELCKYTNIKVIMIHDYSFGLKHPNDDEYFHIIELDIKANSFDRDYYICENIQQNYVRNRTLLDYLN